MPSLSPRRNEVPILLPPPVKQSVLDAALRAVLRAPPAPGAVSLRRRHPDVFSPARELTRQWSGPVDYPWTRPAEFAT